MVTTMLISVKKIPPKISVVALLVVLSTCYTIESRGIKQNPYIQNDATPDGQNCFCFDNYGKNAANIPDLMQPSGLEKLVVYLYKDLDSDQINMHTPNQEKQTLITDLPFENRDGLLPVSAYTSNTILSRNPEKWLIRGNDKLSKDEIKQVSNDDLTPKNYRQKYLEITPELNEAETLENSPVTYVKMNPHSYDVLLEPENNNRIVETSKPNQMKFIEYTDFNQNPEHKQVDKIKSYAQTNVPHVVTFELERQESNDLINNENEGEGKIISELKYDEQQPSPEKYIPSTFSYDHETHEKPITTLLRRRYPNMVNPYIMPYDSGIHQQQNTGSFPLYTKLNIPYIHNIHDQPYSSDVPTYGVHEFDQLIHEQSANNYNTINDVGYQPVNFPVVDNLLLEHLKGYSKPINIIENMKFNNLQPSRNKNQQYPVYNVPYAIPSTTKNAFWEWMVEQSQLFKDLQSGVEDKIDFISIAKSIINILLKNSMYITKNGMLVDSQGKVLDLHNLCLKPILIGNTVPFGDFLKRNGLFSPQTKYIQAILVTVTQPLKLLGLIPLGKAYFPLPIHNNVTNKWNSEPQIIVNKQTLLSDLLKKLSDSEIPEPLSIQLNEPKEENMKSIQDDRKLIQYKPVQSNENLYYNHKAKDDQEKQISYPTTNYYNIKGNENQIARSNLENTISVTSSRRGKKPVHIKRIKPYSKKGYELYHDSLEPVESKSNVGRLFIPRNNLSIKPVLVSSARSNIPYNVDIRRDPFPNFKSNDLPENNVIGNNGSEPMELQPESLLIYSKVENNSDPITKLKELSLVDLHSRRNDIPIYSIEQQPVLNSGIPAQNLYSDENNNIPNFYSNRKLEVPTEESLAAYTEQLDLKEPNVQLFSRLPDMNVLSTSQEISESDVVPVNINEKLGLNKPNIMHPLHPSLVSSEHYSDFMSSRSGTSPEGVVPENSPNGEQLGFLLDGEEDDDDDDGDFRIIGGNAATGSGTPLNNKGRSGYHF